MPAAPNGTKQQAELLARENKGANPDIQQVYWFPHVGEVRLLETTPAVPATHEGAALAFYYPPRPQDGLRLPMGIALIRPEEVRRISPPDEWGSWDDAVEL